MLKFAVITLALVATPALATSDKTAESTSAVSSQAPASLADDPGKKRICRKVVPTGTRMGSRVCGTVAEFKAMDERLRKGAADAFEKSQQQARGQRVDQNY